jgi:Late embryogenesis abundant protein
VKKDGILRSADIFQRFPNFAGEVTRSGFPNPEKSHFWNYPGFLFTFIPKSGNLKPNTVVLLVAAVIAGWWAYTRYGTVTNLQFVPRGIAVSGVGFNVTLGVQNTSNYPLQYNSFAGTLSVNGQQVANVQDFNAVQIAANAETPLILNVSANIFGIASQLFSQVTGGMTGIQSAVLNGVANIGGTQYPVNVTLA